MLNKNKCKIMIINDKENTNLTKIEDIEICKTIKYLGVLLDNKKSCFNSQKCKIFTNGLKLSNQIFSVLGNCFNRMLIGKTFWKGLALPNLLYATECIPFCKTEIDKFQKLDNRAFRYILDVPLYTAREFLRGEIGASSAISRDIKTKFIFIRHALQETSNKLLQQIITTDLEKKITKWAVKVHEYMEDTNLTLTQIRLLSKDQIKRKINEWDRDRWLNSMQEKSTLMRYRENKTQVQECTWLKNGYQYSLMMRARADALNLKWRKIDPNSKRR